MNASRRPLTLGLTPPLMRWLEEDAQWMDQPWSWRLAQRWRAWWGGVNLGLSEARDRQVAAALEDPVLILGPWRSGTTVMHELLAAASGLATPLTWQCMDASAFRLARTAPADTQIARPMDGLAIGPNSPQEDEFALLTMGAPSAYRAFLMPHRIGELHHTLDPEFWRQHADWLPSWESFLRGVLSASPQGSSRALLLKSPNHSFRLPAILRRFPRSRFVWMLRDPQAVLESNRKMWRAMFATHGITAEAPEQLDAFLASALRRCAEMLDWCIAELPPQQWTVCRQASLHSDAEGEVRRVSASLGLPCSIDSAAFRAAIAQTGKGRVDRYRATEEAAALTQATQALDSAQRRAEKHVLSATQQPPDSA